MSNSQMSSLFTNFSPFFVICNVTEFGPKDKADLENFETSLPCSIIYKQRTESRSESSSMEQFYNMCQQATWKSYNIQSYNGFGFDHHDIRYAKLK